MSTITIEFEEFCDLVESDVHNRDECIRLNNEISCVRDNLNRVQAQNNLFQEQIQNLEQQLREKPKPTQPEIGIARVFRRGGDSKKILMIKELRDLTRLGLFEIKILLDRAETPSTYGALIPYKKGLEYRDTKDGKNLYFYELCALYGYDCEIVL